MWVQSPSQMVWYLNSRLLKPVMCNYCMARARQGCWYMCSISMSCGSGSGRRCFVAFLCCLAALGLVTEADRQALVCVVFNRWVHELRVFYEPRQCIRAHVLSFWFSQ
jgi:hypothetical protein